MSAFPQEWDDTDKFLLSTFFLFQYLDYMQTKNIFNNLDEHEEKNSVINWGVEQTGTIFIPIYFVGLTSGCYLIADILESSGRSGALLLFNLGAFNQVGGNVSRGAAFSLNLIFRY